jgi:hypothetical protein
MRPNSKPSIASRATVRSLIVACLPAAAVGFVASSPAVGAVFGEGANHGLTVDDNAVSTNVPATNGAGTNSTGNRTNNDQTIESIEGIRR